MYIVFYGWQQFGQSPPEIALPPEAFDRSVPLRTSASSTSSSSLRRNLLSRFEAAVETDSYDDDNDEDILNQTAVLDDWYNVDRRFVSIHRDPYAASKAVEETKRNHFGRLAFTGTEKYRSGGHVAELILQHTDDWVDPQSGLSTRGYVQTMHYVFDIRLNPTVQRMLIQQQQQLSPLFE